MKEKKEAQRHRPPGRMREMRLAHAYVPFQRFKDNYSPPEALMKGTLYPELWMPYRPGCRGYY